MRALLAVAALALGCAHATTWGKDGATGREFFDDKRDCNAYVHESCGDNAQGLIGALCVQGHFDECMQAKGWAKSRQ